jgi:hypothetical protein
MVFGSETIHFMYNLQISLLLRSRLVVRKEDKIAVSLFDSLSRFPDCTEEPVQSCQNLVQKMTFTNLAAGGKSASNRK